ncbi:TonB-dependent receptor [Niabella ginsenosidivorans]|uniref:TonB-dependent receptor n=1 Tax=Niabella ginsenosidivorans TaxID=1176587 RepID=A0A1A9I718_9BACT|nr:TonB-dependent receptor plug domain-containing protein [Niabella ginsenosidivorans]ANH83373.1 TonB-dependent receptor [Niabella ginsenosidivorans]
MLNKKRILIILLCMGASTGMRAQTGTDSVFAADLFLKLEKTTGYHFYYDARQSDSLLIKQPSAAQATLENILDQALERTELTYAIDDNNKVVYVTRGLKIRLSLPQDLYNPGPAGPVAQKNAPKANEYGIDNKKRRAPTSQEKLYEIGNRNTARPQQAVLVGTIRSSRTGEPFPNVAVLVDNEYAANTDAYGSYSLSIPPGKHTLNITGFGIRETNLNLMVYNDGRMDVSVQDQIPTLKEIVVSATKTRNIRNVQMGISRLTIAEIKKIPTVFGEADILRAITTLPGVKTVGEASTGFNVRGGSADQNLILFNDATIYNPSHFFGMFSAFNPEIVKDVELYKSSVPAKYGGRLSSVLDINSREGNKKQLTGSAGIGLVTSRLELEGPIVKDKTSFILGGRTTYANWLINLLPEEYDKSSASFQDVNLGLSHRIDSNNNIYVNGYYSNDKFKLNSDTVYSYSNRNISVKWKRNFSKRLQGELIGGYDYYKYNINSGANEINAFNLFYDIQQLYGKLNFAYFVNQKHAFDFGLSSLSYKLRPGIFEPLNSESLVRPDTVRTERALENAAYVTHRFNATDKLSFSTGIRYSFYSYLGPQTVNYYADGQPRTDDTRTETVSYGKGKFIKNYQGPEVRFSMRYAFTNDFSIKASYNSLRQYIHLLSNTTAISPTDIWKLSDPNIQPQIGDQFSLGFYKNLRSNTIETSVEVYYKNIKNYLDYKPGATLVMNHTIETDVINTKGKAYGVEVLIKKPVGKLNGWIGYTYSRILLKSTDLSLGSMINNGQFYPANYDKPHDVIVVGNFQINHRFSLSLNSTYSTGRPITYPIGEYIYAGSPRMLYSDRNQYRIPDYYRTDFSMNIDGNHKVHQKTHNSWTIGVYNLLGRRNPYSVYFISEGGMVNGYKLSIFGSAIPFINYNIRF